MTYETLTLESDARGVATLTLNRPERHNALNAALIGELTEAAQTLAADRATRVVVLTGAGESFCAGGDIGWFRDTFALERAGRVAESSRLAKLLATLDALPKPLIGRINGQAFGGGTGLMSVCDLAFGLQDSRFGLTEVRLGLTPANISPYVVARIGAPNARAVMLSGALFNGRRAAEMGLLTAAAEDGTALDALVEAAIADHLEASSQAVAATKAMIAHVTGKVPQSLQDWTAEQLANAWETEDGKTGIACFLEKRRPPWRTRGTRPGGKEE